MLSEKDLELIGLLKINARESVASLARKLDVSRSTVQDRLRRLETSGVIAGYQVKLDGGGVPGIQALVEITIEPAKIAAILGELKSIANIETLHTVSGKYDLVAMMRASTSERADMALDKIGAIAGIVSTSSAIILSTKLDRR
jgi:DNA-binding Lrp family transcriptional regulator